MSRFVHSTSIADVYEFLNSGKPAHPLITLIREWPQSEHDISQIKFTSDLYYLAMKSKKAGAFQYGRNSYDYQEGTMIFIGPGQVATFSGEPDPPDGDGWTILFHPDLVRRSSLEAELRRYSFFRYEINEALHLAEKEREFLHTIADKIEQEIHQNIDKHSTGIIVQHVETILKYCQRYYERQFYMRTNINKDHISRFENFLNEYFESTKLSEQGVPTVEGCGRALNMSAPYLSDLLRAETGRSASDHIYGRLIDLAKSRLLASEITINELAYTLGFEYPQHFSKLFKTKTGFSPSEYRKLN